MSTEVLNRRMDLIHSFTNGVHYLTMDTSYPVKVDGLVLKLFVATSDYSDNATSDSKAFCIKTANNTNTIANITKDNVLNFKKKKLEDNAFKKNDYVMAIIDIYNQKLYLCSQTDFAKLKTEDDTPVGDFCKLKMFDITNDTETLDKLNEYLKIQKNSAKITTNDIDEKIENIRLAFQSFRKCILHILLNCFFIDI